MARAIGSYPVGHLFESDRRYHAALNFAAAIPPEKTGGIFIARHCFSPAKPHFPQQFSFQQNAESIASGQLSARQKSHQNIISLKPSLYPQYAPAPESSLKYTAFLLFFYPQYRDRPYSSTRGEDQNPFWRFGIR